MAENELLGQIREKIIQIQVTTGEKLQFLVVSPIQFKTLYDEFRDSVVKEDAGPLRENVKTLLRASGFTGYEPWILFEGVYCIQKVGFEDSHPEKQLIYLASPYSCNPDPPCGDTEIQVAKVNEGIRFNQVCHAAADLFKNGELVYSPIAHLRPIANAGKLEHGFDVFAEHDIAMMQKCERFMVLKLPGWETSIGIQAEIKFAESIGRKIEYIEV